MTVPWHRSQVLRGVPQADLMSVWTPQRGEAPMKDLRCLVMWHKYVEKHSPDGDGVYLECRQCGTVKDRPDGRETMGYGA